MVMNLELPKEQCRAFHPDRGIKCLLDTDHPGAHRNHGLKPGFDWPRKATGRVTDRRWWRNLERRLLRNTR